MSQLIIKHKVKDFLKWKVIFNSSKTIRKMYGEVDCKIFRNTEDPNDVSILFEWESPEKVMKYAQSKELQSAMKLSGVISEPVIYLLDGVMEG